MNSFDNSGFTALHYAAYSGNQNYVSYLIQQKAPINVLDYNGHSALFWAIKGGHANVVKLLIENHAFINPRDQDNGYSVLAYCVFYRQYQDLLKLLINNVNFITEKDLNGNTKLDLAIMNENLGIIEVILKKYPELIEKYNQYGLAPLHYAIF